MRALSARRNISRKRENALVDDRLDELEKREESGFGASLGEGGEEGESGGGGGSVRVGDKV